MPPAQELTSADNPRIKAVVRLRQHKERRATGQFVAEGVREVSRALAAGLAPSSVFFCPSIFGISEPRQLSEKVPALASAGAALFSVPSNLFLKITYRDDPEGILAVFDQPTWRLDDFPAPQEASPELWLVAVGTQKPGNLGAMARSADAAGITGMLVSDAVVDAFNPNAIRASTGAVFTVPILSAEAGQILTFLARRRVRVLAAAPDGAQSYTQVNLKDSIALVIGPEDTGLDQRWLAAAQVERIAIPMHGRTVDSLNASVAAAVLLFEVVRQRGGR